MSEQKMNKKRKAKKGKPATKIIRALDGEQEDGKEEHNQRFQEFPLLLFQGKHRLLRIGCICNSEELL